MRCVTLCVVMSALLIAGCAQEAGNGVAPGIVAPAAPKAATPALPYQGKIMWAVTGVDWAGIPGSGARSTFGGRCPCGAEALMHGLVEGEVTHAGLTTATASMCFNFTWAPEGPLGATYSDGIAYARAANGSTFELRYTDGVAATDPQTGEYWWRDRWTIVGGTGLFAGASGEGNESGLAPSMASMLSGVPAPMSQKGTIRFAPGAN